MTTVGEQQVITGAARIDLLEADTLPQQIVDKTADLSMVNDAVRDLLVTQLVEVEPVTADYDTPTTNPLTPEQQQLAADNLGIARNRAKHYSRWAGVRNLQQSDLESAAMYGLVRAARRFDPSRGVPFVAFASTSISGAIKHEFRDNFIIRDRYSPTPINVDSGNALIQQEGPIEFLDAIPDPSAECTLENTGLKLLIASALDRLSDPRYAEIVRLRYGLEPHDGVERTQAEIGKEIGCSQYHVSRLLKAALVELGEILGSEEALLE